MSDIFLQDTLSGEKKKFVPIKEGEVSMYNCGPTVYNYQHIGNFRTAILADLLRRIFEYNQLKVNQVMNITDIDDKTIKRSIDEGVTLKELTEKYEEIFFADLHSLNILLPTKTPKATESVDEIISLIAKLLEKGIAYKSADGIYFDITKSKDYGQLARINLENNTKERIANDEYDKENPRDFSLWKFYTEDDGNVFYEAPFGNGRPGWHIECSAMSMRDLGETIDVHTGGTDLLFPHHTNEIAQSEGATGKQFVHYWIHGAMITVDGKKMAKSLNNFFTLENLKEKSIDPLAYRYFVLGAHYSSMLNFTWEALEGAQTALKRLRTFMSKGAFDMEKSNSEKTELYKNKFIEHVNNDLDTPKALALVWEIIKDENISEKDKAVLILTFDKVLGLKLDEIETVEIPEEVKLLILVRDKARAEKDFAKSDEIRAKIEKLGFEVMDTSSGTAVSAK